MLLIRFSLVRVKNLISVSLPSKCESRASLIIEVASWLNLLGPFQFTCTSLDRDLGSKLLLFLQPWLLIMLPIVSAVASRGIFMIRYCKLQYIWNVTIQVFIFEYHCHFLMLLIAFVLLNLSFNTLYCCSSSSKLPVSSRSVCQCG